MWILEYCDRKRTPPREKVNMTFRLIRLIPWSRLWVTVRNAISSRVSLSSQMLRHMRALNPCRVIRRPRRKRWSIVLSRRLLRVQSYKMLSRRLSLPAARSCKAFYRLQTRYQIPNRKRHARQCINRPARNARRSRSPKM